MTRAAKVRVMAYPTAPIAAGSLIGGYAVARFSHRRQLGGAVLTAGALAGANQWRRLGPSTTAALMAVYLGGFGVSHPLAKRIGAWPAVLSVSGLSGGASYLLADRRLRH
jgi:hypothetical protein